MTTMQLECFLAVAETLSFAKAAGKLSVTQPAVTQQIRALEEEMDVQLFKRTTRIVRLTPEGHVFLNDARSILNMIYFTKKRFQEHNSKESLPFCIGCHSHDELMLLPEVLKGMKQEYPVIHPVFQVIPFQHLFQLLAEELVDVIISFQEKNKKESYGTYREFVRIPVMGIMTVQHPMAAKSHLTKKDLASERIILIAPQRCPGRLNDICHELTKDKAVTDLMLCDTPEAALLLAKAGFGIAILPKLTAMADRGLAYIPINGADMLSYGAYYKSVKGKPLLKLFLQLCREYFSRTLS